jgi:hypothetical protein
MTSCSLLQTNLVKKTLFPEMGLLLLFVIILLNIIIHDC